MIASGHSDLLPYVSSLREFNKVRKACFGQDLSIDTVEADVERFKDAYVKTGMSITTKAHILFEHVVPYCMQRGKGLGFYSEQVG